MSTLPAVGGDISLITATARGFAALIGGQGADAAASPIVRATVELLLAHPAALRALAASRPAQVSAVVDSTATWFLIGLVGWVALAVIVGLVVAQLLVRNHRRYPLARASKRLATPDELADPVDRHHAEALRAMRGRS